MTAPLIELRGISKAYSGIPAVADVDLTLESGQIVGLVGKNGAGKSTLIKILAGAVQADSGHILIDGKEVSLRRPLDATRLGLAFVHQDLVLAPNLTVAENIELGLGFPKSLGIFVDWAGLRAKTAAFLSELGVDIDGRLRITELSVVQQRLVMIARALSQRARLIVLDEPTASLTPTEIEHLHEVVRGLASSGVAVVYVTHRLDEVLSLTERVVVMRDARKVDDLPTSELDETQLIGRIIGAESGAARAASADRLVRTTSPGAEMLRVEHLVAPPFVRDVSFTLREGEILGIAGLVGSGRTELVRALFGADRAESGRILLHGEDVHISSPRHGMRNRIVLLPENRKTQGMLVNQPIRANITLPTLAQHRRNALLPSPSRRRERSTTRFYTDQLRIRSSGPEQLAGSLSGGNQQKVVIAKWLRHGADVFILDEPTQGVDVEGKEEVYRIMVELADQGGSVIFISSEFAEFEPVCDRVIVMREGLFVAELDRGAITEEAILERCFATDVLR